MGLADLGSFSLAADGGSGRPRGAVPRLSRFGGEPVRGATLSACLGRCSLQVSGAQLLSRAGPGGNRRSVRSRLPDIAVTSGLTCPEEATTLSRSIATPLDAKALVAAAQSLADERKHAEVQPLHLLVRALGRDLGVRAVFERGVSNLLEFEAALERALGQSAALERARVPVALKMLDPARARAA